MRCDILVRQDHKVVVLPSVTSRHGPDNIPKITLFSTNTFIINGYGNIFNLKCVERDVKPNT